jgi:hypothetical protein
MFYVFSHVWFWILCAFIVGGVVGWKTCGGKRA